MTAAQDAIALVADSGDNTPETVRAALTAVLDDKAYGQISAVANATETAIAEAGTAVQVTVFDTDGPSLNTTPDHTNDHIEIDQARVYAVLVSATVNSVAGLASRFELSVRRDNGTVEIIPRVHRNVGGGGTESGVVSLSGLVSLAAGATVEVWIENETNTQNYVIEDISLMVTAV